MATHAERQRKYRVNSRQKWLAAQKRYRENHREERRKDGRERERKRREKARKDVISALGGKCGCGFSDIRALHVDHVHDDGKVERILFNKDFVKLRRHIAKNADSGRWQILCANCNSIKQWDAMREKRDHDAWPTRRRANQHSPERPEAGL